MDAVQRPHTGIDDLLNESGRTKECAVGIIEKYASGLSASEVGKLESILDPRHGTGRDGTVKDDAVEVGILQKNADAAKASFVEALKSYENEADAKYKTGVTIDDRYTMQQIWDELDDAIEKYQKKGTQGLRGRVRGVGRKIGKHSEVVEGWLGLLPTQSQYLSVVLGGLKLIIKAAGRMKGVSDEIMVALSELPAMFDTTKRAQTLYGAKSLEAITWELYTSMVKALGHILEYLRRSLHRKILKAWLQHSRFENELSEKIKDMKACKDRFIEEVDMCEKEMVGRIDSRTKTTEDTVHEIHLSTNMLVKLLLGNPAVLDLAYEFRKRLDTPAAGTKSQEPLPMPEDLRQRLLSRLKYDPEAIGADVAANYASGARLGWEEQERSLYVIKSSKLASWATTTQPSALVVHGNARTVKRKSALSFVCARLVHSLDQIREKQQNGRERKANVVVLNFFCGEHAGGDHKWETPSGIVNSLLAQLLTQVKDVDLTQADSYGIFDQSKLKAVLKRFECVLTQLPPNTTVFCILDALAFYVDNAATEHDAGRLIKHLLRLARTRSRNRPVFKLLLTAPKNMHTSEVDHLGDNEVIHVPKSLPRTGGFTAMKWDLGMGRRLYELAQGDDD